MLAFLIGAEKLGWLDRFIQFQLLDVRVNIATKHALSCNTWKSDSRWLESLLIGLLLHFYLDLVFNFARLLSRYHMRVCLELATRAFHVAIKSAAGALDACNCCRCILSFHLTIFKQLVFGGGLGRKFWQQRLQLWLSCSPRLWVFNLVKVKIHLFYFKI